jgi:hypothetical protein
MEEVVNQLVRRIRKLETQDPGPIFHIQDTDPGAVGAYEFWLNTITNELKYRDPTNTSWIAVV